MKRHFILISLILISFLSSAQMHERGRKNFYVEPFGAINFSNSKKKAYGGSEYGFSYGISAGKQFAGLFRLGLQYQYNQHKVGFYTTEQLYSVDFKRNLVGVKGDLLLPFFSYYLGKSKKYECTMVTNYFIVGPEFDFVFSEKNSFFTGTPNEFMLNAAWAMLFKKSGGRKTQAANDIYVSLNFKKSFSSFGKLEVYNQNFYSVYYGVSLIWIRYKTSNWLKN